MNPDLIPYTGDPTFDELEPCEACGVELHAGEPHDCPVLGYVIAAADVVDED